MVILHGRIKTSKKHWSRFECRAVSLEQDQLISVLYSIRGAKYNLSKSATVAVPFGLSRPIPFQGGREKPQGRTTPGNFPKASPALLCVTLLLQLKCKGGRHGQQSRSCISQTRQGRSSEDRLSNLPQSSRKGRSITASFSRSFRPTSAAPTSTWSAAARRRRPAWCSDTRSPAR